MAETPPDKLRATLVKALREVERLRNKIASSEAAATEPIAIVGVGLRLPGGVVDLASLWAMLANQVDAVAPIPDTRWSVEASFDPDPETAGKSYVREAALLDDIDGFDPAFFHISPREAKAIDPQHRLLLEAGYEALERAGIIPDSLVESPTGVFVGIGPSDYERLRAPNEGDAYAILGTHSSFAAGRLAFTLQLQGPAISLDTACSSSLAALHLACASLRARESNLALAAGVQVLAGPEPFIKLSRTRALAPDGRCKTFSAEANGYGRGEGVVVLALERLSDAQAAGREILALVRGTAVNHDGPSSGITVPNGVSQQKVLRAALADAQLDPADIDVVECHGTGTSLGDPIEVQALAEVYGKRRPDGRPLLLGAIKTNIGHLESAAGLAGVVKILAALEHGELPPSLHTTPRNPLLDWDQLAVDVVDRPRPWPRGEDRPRRAGVSAFGLSGTNAHVLLEEAPADENQGQPPQRPALHHPLPFLVSARSDAALQQLHSRLRRHVDQRRPALADLAHSLVVSRAAMERRAFVVASSTEQLLTELDHPLSPRSPLASPTLALLFTGQGAQRVRMGQRLGESFPAFARALQQLCLRFDDLLEVPLAEVLAAAPGSERAALLDRTAYTQPALFAVELALYQLYRTYGPPPQLVLGHSIGELIAAHVAGVLSLDDAVQLVAARGRLMESMPDTGGMLSVQATEAELEALLASHPGVDIAGLNGPMSTVLSGDEDPLAAVQAHFDALGRKTRRLAVSHAFHSHHMDAMLDEFRAVVAKLELHAPTLGLISNLTGQLAKPDELRDPDYWVRQVRAPVRFFDGVRSLELHGVNLMLELGPRAVLTAMAAACISEPNQDQVGLVSCLGKGKDDDDESAAFVGALAQLHGLGLDLDWTALFAPLEPRVVELPTYPFQRQRYWIDPPARPATDLAAVGLEVSEHPLLGAMTAIAEQDSLLFTTKLELGEHPWLGDHVIFDHVLFPGTGFLDLALTAAVEVGDMVVEELSLQDPLILREGEPVNLQLVLSRPDESGRRSLQIHSRASASGREGRWTLHASGSLVAAPPSSSPFGLEQWPPPGAEAVSLDEAYPRLAALGLGYGPAFRGLREVWRHGDELFIEVGLPEGLEADEFAIHPALLDAVLHAPALIELGDADPGSTTVSLPFAWSEARLFARGASVLRARLVTHGSTLELELSDGGGAPLAQARLQVRPASSADIRGALARRSEQSLYRLHWRAVPEAELGARRRPTAILADETPSWAPSWDGVASFESLDELLERGDASAILLLLPDSQRSPEAATARLLSLLQRVLVDERLADSRLVLVTRRALAVGSEDVLDLAHAPAWGLIRTAQAERGDLGLSVVDVDEGPLEREQLERVLAAEAAQLAIRGGIVLGPRLGPARSPDIALPPANARAWHLDSTAKGNLDNLLFVDASELLERELLPGEVLLRVHATGLNFRDVINALGMFPGDPGPLGYEGAGVVEAVGSEVRGLEVGDRVMGLLRAGFGSHSVVDQRMVVPIPERWSLTQAASTPLVFLTAYFAFVDLAALGPGEKVLIHAATGGVGMAAVQLARHIGAEPFVTASRPKWPILRELGFDDDHIANSRTLAFADEFLALTGGEGVDVVLDALAREFVDASLRLLPRGGRFLEMGKTDVREPEQVAAEHPGVVYRAFDLIDAGLDRIQEMLGELVELFAAGHLRPLPTRIWDGRHAPEAFRYVAQAKHIGKVVLEMPRPLDPLGTVLISGGTGALGALVAEHLVTAHGHRRLLLSSRRGPAAPGARELRTRLEELGAEVEIVACDAAERSAVAALLEAIPEAHPLTALIHTAGVLDDGLLGDLDAQRIARVFAPKVDATLNLHELTRELPLAHFIVFSSFSGTLGSPGQGNYAAANAFLDALCAHRRALGLPATSLAWGPWAEGGMAARLSEAERARMKRMGMPPLSFHEGLELFDAALLHPEPTLIPVHLDLDALALRADELSPIFHGLVRASGPRVASEAAQSDGSLIAKLAALSSEERGRLLLELVRAEVAAVMGLARPQSVPSDQPLQELGLDSLMAVELRNRLQSACDTRLPATLLFDHPTATSIVALLLDKLGPELGAEDPTHPRAAGAPVSEEQLRRQLARIPIDALRGRGLLPTLLELVPTAPTSDVGAELPAGRSIDDMSVDELVDLALSLAP